MTVTNSDLGPDRQGTGNGVTIDTEEDFHNARARDRQRTSSGSPLPDTERVQEAIAGWFAAVKELASRLLDGSFWDEQPPSPRELVERWRDSRWTHSDYQAIRILRWLGMVASIAWSLPLYGVAIIGQRIGRALITALIVWAFSHLI